VSGKVSHPYKTIGKDILLYTVICSPLANYAYPETNAEQLGKTLPGKAKMKMMFKFHQNKFCYMDWNAGLLKNDKKAEQKQQGHDF
jgi:hypothetical protein